LLEQKPKSSLTLKEAQSQELQAQVQKMKIRQL